MPGGKRPRPAICPARKYSFRRQRNDRATRAGASGEPIPGQFHDRERYFAHKGLAGGRQTNGVQPFARPLFLTNEFGLILLIVVFAVIFGVAASGFLSPFNLFTLGRSAAINIMIGLSMMAVIVTGGLNLAVGAIGVSAAMACGYLIEVLGVPWPLALIGGLSTGASLGFVNGWTVIRTGLHSFIITLATMSIFSA